jgi:prepilin-type N-terminal cleavage/methylation domain-containing protein
MNGWLGGVNGLSGFSGGSIPLYRYRKKGLTRLPMKMTQQFQRLKACHGFTLVEVVVTLAIIGIIATMAVPSFSSYFDKRRVIEAAEDLYSNMQLARSEAIARSTDIYVRFNTTGADWQYGVSLNNLCDLTKTDPTVANANACVLVVDNGDGNIDTGDATTDSADLILHRFTDDDYTDISMTLNTIPANNQINFDPTRGTADNATITLQSSGGFQMRLIVGVLGQIRVCSPAGTTHVNGYSSDGC